jgi:Flp pilus assembly protein TadD
VLQQAGLFEESIAELDRAIELDPTGAALHAARAFAYSVVGDVVEARAGFERAIELADDPAFRAQLEAALDDLPAE